MRPPLILVLVALAAFGWCLPWDDPARAGAALQWVSFGGLCLMLKRGADRLGRLACAAGSGVAIAGAGCAAFFAALTSQQIGSCDEGTGRPVTLAAGLALLAVCAQFMESD